MLSTAGTDFGYCLTILLMDQNRDINTQEVCLPLVKAYVLPQYI